ncbi:MAG: hypothetical protein RIT28_3910 [Pseudomonadota bacterium]
MTTLSLGLTRLLASGRPDRAWDLAEGALGDADFRVRVLAHRALADLISILPPVGWTDRHRAVAERLKLSSPRASWSPGEALFPVVHGAASRLVKVTVRARFGGEDQLPAEREHLAASFAAARRVLNEPDLRFEANFAPSEGWDGASAGLALALAAVSAARAGVDLSLVVATGEVNAAGDVLNVGQIAEKQRLCREAAPRATLLTPTGEALALALGVLPVNTLAEALEQLGRWQDPEEALRRVLALERDGRWKEAAQRAGPLLADPRYSAYQLASLLTVCLAAANHSADVANQATFASTLVDLLDELDGSALAQAIGHLAVRAIDTFNPERADEVLAFVPLHSVKARHRVFLLGPAALLNTLRGEHVEALGRREQALKIAPADERPRALGDLADALMRVDRGEEALACAQEALRLVETTAHRQGYQVRTTSFLRLHLARALGRVGRRDEALAALAHIRQRSGDDPALRAELLHAELTGDLPAAQSLHQTFGSTGIVRALTLRTLARLGDAEAARALLALPVFGGLTVEEAARRLPY